MPKTYLSDADRALARFQRWYKSAKAGNDVTDAQIARKLDVTQQAVSYKMKKGSLTLTDLMLIFRELGATDEEILKIMKM